MQKNKKIFIIAGEASGDFIGSRLMVALKNKDPSVDIVGIGGPLMCNEGLNSLFPMEELSLMGIAEVIPHLMHLKNRINQTVKAIIDSGANIVVTIDSPDFCHRVSKKVKKICHFIKTVHYVAPSVWAWRAGRAKKIAKHLDHLLALFPFEPQYFQPYNLPTTFVGHPIVEAPLENTSSLSIQNTKNRIVVLLGSRNGEVKSLLPIFSQACALYYTSNPNSFFWIPTFEKFSNDIEVTFKKLNIPFCITTTTAEKWQAFQQATIAIAASGTVSLELAKAGLLSVIAYKTSPITAFLVRLLIKTKFVCLVNIILGKKVLPELLQNDCTPQKIVEAMHEISENAKQIKSYLNQCFQMLKPKNGQLPSNLAADIILSYLA